MPTVLFSEQSGLGDGDPVVSLPGTGTSVPRGVEALFDYDGFLLNDRSVIDKYRVISIDGLDDPDIRDSREDNPAAHGETPYDAHYGGRTIALNGRVEAYTLNKLRDMQQAMRTAFSDISREKKLKFLTGDPTVDHYIWCKKFSKNQWSEVQTSEHAFFREFLITLRASNPRFFKNQTKTYELDANDTISVSNIGNFSAQPKFVLSGPLDTVAFQIESENGERIEEFALDSAVSISGGTTYIVDIARNTIIDNTGANKFSDLDFTSAWPEIYPGNNLIVNTTTANTGTIEIIFNDTWI